MINGSTRYFDTQFSRHPRSKKDFAPSFMFRGESWEIFLLRPAAILETVNHFRFYWKFINSKRLNEISSCCRRRKGNLFMMEKRLRKVSEGGVGGEVLCMISNPVGCVTSAAMKFVCEAIFPNKYLNAL